MKVQFDHFSNALGEDDIQGNSRFSQDDLQVNGHDSQLLDQLPAAVYTCDANGIITYYNTAAAQLWGRKPAIGKDYWCGSWKIFDTKGIPMPLDECPMAIALREKRAVLNTEIVVERPDGKRLSVIPHPRPLFDGKGNLVGGINMLVDVTERNVMNASIKESEERLRMMAEQSPIVVWMTDNKGSIIYLNKKWTEITGSEKINGLGKGWFERIHSEDKSLVLLLWEEAFAERKNYEQTFRYLKTDNTYIITRATGSPRYNSKGQFVGYIGTQLDITRQEMEKITLEKTLEQRTAELEKKNEELRRSEERYHRMIAEVQDYAIILLSKEGIIQNWNKGAEKIKGYSAEEAVGKSFHIFYSAEDRERKLPNQLLNRAAIEGRATHEGWRVRKDGTYFWGSVVITALHDTTGAIVGFSKVTRDLTDRRNAEVRLQEKNRELESMNQELASFAYVSSHDLQEPLRKIQTFASRIMETELNNLSEKGKDYFLRMQNAALRMQTLIEDLLSYSRTNTKDKNFEIKNLNEIIEDIRHDLREGIEEKNAKLITSKLPTLEVIPFQFRQLMVNILSNALKFSKENVPPIIKISADVVNGSDIPDADKGPHKNYNHIKIEDNGIGFEPEHRGKIFELFQRLHGRSEYTGTGIGLAICKKIMDNHDGIIAADSVLGEGATFHLYFPINNEKAPA